MAENRELRASARENLGGSIFHSEWLMAMLACLVASAILTGPSLAFTLIRNRDSTQFRFNLLSSATIFLEGPLGVGLAGIFLDKARHMGPISFGNLFQGFTSYWDNFLVGFMPVLFTMLWALIPIAGIFIAIYKAYGWSMVFYIKQDNPVLSWRECMDQSKEMMEGLRWRYFCLQFSFIGWYLLGVLALGVGTNWVNAYEKAATANFYLELRRTRGLY